LLGTGKMVAKRYEIVEPGKVRAELALYNLAENSLIGFNGWITSLLAERDTLTTSPFQFHEYVTEVFKN
jgi:hypothetical protein